MDKEEAWMGAMFCGACAGVNAAFIPTVPFAIVGVMICLVGTVFYISHATRG